MAARAAFLLAVLMTLKAQAQVRMSVADVESLLSSHMSPDAISTRVPSIELTERATSVRLGRWEGQVRDQKARWALEANADVSAFQPLPSADLSATPPPNEATQHEILSRTAEYVANMRPRLPNFSALRTTAHFELATPEDLESEERAMQFEQMSRERLGYVSLGAYSRDLHWFRLGEATSTVTYRDGKEVRTPEPEMRGRLRLTQRGLESWGEFGSILSVVDHDAMNSAIAWDHWEQGPHGLLAVFRCSVAKEQSHFAIYSPGSLPGMLPVEQRPAYRCEIAADPDDGSIHRISVQTQEEDPAVVTGIVVQYAPTEIGGKTYMCPVHAIGVLTTRDSTDVAQSGSIHRWVNDATFTQYHLFRSESRMLPEYQPPPD